jgi:hypothetical protein
MKELGFILGVFFPVGVALYCLERQEAREEQDALGDWENEGGR